MTSERHAFVLRLWMEDVREEAERPSSLRGSLHVVETGRVIYFSSLDMLPDLLNQFFNEDTEDTNHEKHRS